MQQIAKAKNSKTNNGKRTNVERKKRNQQTASVASVIDDASAPHTTVSKHLAKHPGGLQNQNMANMMVSEGMAQPQQVPAVQPPQPEKKKDKKKVFLCSPCGTHYENWNLFVHMREVHRKHICLYCLGIFPSAERLVTHLGTKHGVLKKHHGSLEEYASASDSKAQHQPFYLMCSRCEHMFESTASNLLEKEEQIRAHDCANYLETCSNCGQLKQPKHRCDVAANGTISSGKKKPSKKSVLSGSIVGTPRHNVPQQTFDDCDATTTNGNVSSHGAADTPSKAPVSKGTSKSSSRKKQRNTTTPQLQNSFLSQEQHHQQLATGSSILQTQLLRDVKCVLEQQSLNEQCYATGPRPQLDISETAPQHPPLMNGDFSHPTEHVAAPPIHSSTPPPYEGGTTVSTPLSTVAQQQTSDLPPPVATTPLVPKLKVKIPIQYLTPMESEESSAESEEDEEEEEEEDEEEEAEAEAEEEEEVENEAENEEAQDVEENAEIKEAKEEKVERETDTVGSEIVENSETATVKHLEGKIEHFNEVKNDNQHGFEQTETLQENVAVAEDTALQEPVPMDIDESLQIERRRDVPASVSIDSKSPHGTAGPAIEPSAGIVAGADETVAPKEQEVLSNSLSSLAAPGNRNENVLEKTDLGDNLAHNSPKTENNAASVEFDDDGTEEKTATTESSPLIGGEVVASVSDSSNIEQPNDVCSGKDQMVIADSDAQLFTLALDEPLDRISIREFIRICLRETVPYCLYCNHARRIAVNGRQLVLHIIAMHRFQATVNSITGEELLPETILQRFLNALDELEAERAFLNMETFDNSWTTEQRAAVPFAKVFECFQCRFVTVVHKELYLHNRKMHQKSVLLCLMCKGNFFSYSELLCHMCP
uniref:C2H2-type domain-containing protein n=1 Tax=Anopheles maculatus TaxID=74869 RepID=A0A182STC8_9DIPT